MNDSTTVNVNVNGSDSTGDMLNNAGGNFAGLWKQMALGQGVASLVQDAVELTIKTIGDSIKTAADFQTQIVRLNTSAGESKDNLKLVADGIDHIAISTGTTLEQLGKGAYTIESAGFHGADALKVLKAASEGAKTEGADLGKVTDAVTSALRDYNMPASAAADVTSKMVTAVGQGKTTFEQLTGSLHSVLPLASALHVPMSDILGDLASMTVHGMSADQATQNMAEALRKMQSPTSAMTGELAQLGIKSSDLAEHLGTKGLSGTLQEISDAIMKKMGPAGKVMLDAFNGNKVQAEDAMKMMSAMPQKLQDIAEGYKKGTLSLKDYRTDLKSLPADQANLLQQFVNLNNKANGFSDVLKSGKNASQDYGQALAAATGDATTMNVALMLTGDNAAYTKGAVDAVGKSAAEAGGHVLGWAEIQGTFNQKWSEFQAGMQVGMQKVGEVFLPILSAIIDGLMAFGKWIGQVWQAAQPFINLMVAVFKPALDELGRALGELWKSFQPIWQVIQGPVMMALGILAAMIFGPMIAAFAAIGVAAYILIKIGTFFVELYNVAARMIGAVIGAIGEFNRIMNQTHGNVQAALAGAGTWLYNAGRDIINGLVNGIKSMIGGAADAVKNVASGAVDAAKKMLGIHSPSTVFADIGENMGKGLIQGIENIKDAANLSVTSLVQTDIVANNNPMQPFSNQAPASNTTSYSSADHSSRNITIQQVVLASDSAANAFFDHLTQDNINVGKGLSPVQGAY